MLHIETITNSAAGEFDFDNIPSGYSRLHIKGVLRGDVSATSEIVYAFLNTDTTVGNYHFQRISAVNGTAQAFEGAQPRTFIVPGATGVSNVYATVALTIEEYTGTQLKVISSEFYSVRASGEVEVGIKSVVSSITDVVNRIRIRTDNHPTDQLLGTLRLYGEY